MLRKRTKKSTNADIERSNSGKGRLYVFVSVLLIALITAGAGYYWFVLRSNGFLYRSGDVLMYNNKPYKFIGVTALDMLGCDSGYSTDDIGGFFKALPNRTITRVAVGSDVNVDKLDQLVATAESHGQMLAIVLDGASEPCGAGQDRRSLTDDWYKGGSYEAAQFELVDKVVTRYTESSAIGIWEVAYKTGWGCEGGYCRLSKEDIRVFIDEVAAKIKDVDSNHLVGSGTAGLPISGVKSKDDFVYIHSGSNVDLVSLYDYEYDSWYGNEKLPARYFDIKSAAESIDKPLIVAELGVKLLQPSNQVCYDSSKQAEDIIKTKLGSYFDNGATGVMIQGWMKQKPESKPDGCMGDYGFYGNNNPILRLIKEENLRINK